MLEKSWTRLRTKPHVDAALVGATFVDVLFALVVGYMLMPAATWWKISEAGWANLAVAATLTLTSWIGYHNSAYRPRWLIAFPNLPLALFLLDITMVVTYAFSVFVAADITPGASNAPKLLPEAAVVAFSFVLYAGWDAVNLVLTDSRGYQDAWRQAHADGILKATDVLMDNRHRRFVTIGCCTIAVVLALVAYGYDHSTKQVAGTTVVLFDIILILLLIGFRLAKEFVTPN